MIWYQQPFEALIGNLYLLRKKVNFFKNFVGNGKQITWQFNFYYSIIQAMYHKITTQGTRYSLPAGELNVNIVDFSALLQQTHHNLQFYFSFIIRTGKTKMP
jgi:hypothetical protein